MLKRKRKDSWALRALVHTLGGGPVDVYGVEATALFAPDSDERQLVLRLCAEIRSLRNTPPTF